MPLACRPCAQPKTGARSPKPAQAACKSTQGRNPRERCGLAAVQKSEENALRPRRQIHSMLIFYTLLRSGTQLFSYDEKLVQGEVEENDANLRRFCVWLAGCGWSL